MTHIQFPNGQPLTKRHISDLLVDLALIWNAVDPELLEDSKEEHTRLRYFLTQLRANLKA